MSHLMQEYTNDQMLETSYYKYKDTRQPVYPAGG